MKQLRKVINSALIFMLCISLCSCSLFIYDHSRFEGGKQLDDELLSEIRAEIFAEESVDISDNNSKDSENGESGEDTIEAKESNAETSLVYETDENNSENSQETESDVAKTVYWVAGGTVWHLSPNCRYLKNSKNVVSGSEIEAIAAGIDRACSACKKNTQ